MLRIDVPDGSDPYVHILSKGAYALVAARTGLQNVQYSSATGLSPREREGMRYRIACMMGCGHCLDVRMGRDKPGFSPEPIPEELYTHVLKPGSWDGYSERERLAIGFAERFALNPRELRDDDAFWSRISANFTEHEIADLCLLCGYWVGTGWTVMVLGLGDVCEAPSAANTPRKLKVEADFADRLRPAPQHTDRP